nr:uncharacterized protein LOC109155798 [Ipomoea trifida]
MRILLSSIEPKVVPEVFWMEEIRQYKEKGDLPDDPAEAAKIQRRRKREQRNYKESPVGPNGSLDRSQVGKSKGSRKRESAETIEGVWEGGDGRSASEAGKVVSGVAGEAGGVSPKESSAKNSARNSA